MAATLTSNDACLITNEACLAHDTGPGHPESPARLRAVLDALAAKEFASLAREEAPLAKREDLVRVHAESYVTKILGIAPPPGQYVALDPDTIMSSGSREAALLAAGGAIAGVDAVMERRARACFVAVRPPGHHAERGRAMGFCLFNNVAIAALHARAAFGVRRIAIADFDVHHGNGTEAIVRNDPDIFYTSTHQSPHYPGTGAATERGVANNVLNVPLQAGTDGRVFRDAWATMILPALERFAPELLLLSAGFDAHRADPLADLRLDVTDFAWLSREFVGLAARHSEGRIVSVLEGGYDIDALAAGAAAHVRALMAG